MDLSDNEYFSPFEGEGFTNILEVQCYIATPNQTLTDDHASKNLENDEGGKGDMMVTLLTPVSCYWSSGKYGSGPSQAMSNMAQKVVAGNTYFIVEWPILLQEATEFKGSRVGLTFPHPMNPEFYLPNPHKSQMQVCQYNNAVYWDIHFCLHMRSSQVLN